MAGYNEDGTPRLRYDEGGNVVGYTGMGEEGVAAPSAYTQAMARQNFGQNMLLMPTGWDTPQWADWQNIVGGTGQRYATMEDYYKDVYGGGRVKYTTDPNGDNQVAYFDPEGRTADPSKYITNNAPDSKLGQLVLAGILAGGAAGLSGMLPGTESVFGGAGVGAADAAPVFTGGASGGTISGAAAGGGSLSGLSAAEVAAIGGGGGALTSQAAPTVSGASNSATAASQAIDGSAQSLYDAAAGAGVPGYDAALTSGVTGASATSTAASDAIGRILDGTATASDWAQVLGSAGGALLGVAGSNAQGDAYRDVADKYLALGSPYRDLLSASYQPGFSIADQPDFQNALDVGANAAARATSARSGNPVDNPGAYAEMQKYITGSLALPQLNTYRSQLGSFGQLGTNTAGTNDTNAAGQTSGAYNALGYGLGQITQPQSLLSGNNGGALSRLLLNSGQFL